MMHYFRGSLIFTVCALGAAAFLGYYSGGLSGMLHTLFIVTILAILETSLSFDNAIVNASRLEHMDAIWRRHFLTWGMLIAVFGMRVVFPLAIVGVAGHLDPLAAITLAFDNPVEYGRILTSAHAAIVAFGGVFLLMVGLRYFFDAEKDVHWMHFIERHLVKSSQLYLAEVLIISAVLVGSAYLLPESERFIFLVAGIGGLCLYAFVQWLEVFFSEDKKSMNLITTQVARSGLAGFIYLQVLDASFSFDGVIGAFALSNNILVIGLGLGIGAMFVRSMTVMLVEKGTLVEYRYLEHGAFWAILGLAACMFIGLQVDIPEAVTGLIGVVFIVASFISSLKDKHARTV